MHFNISDRKDFLFFQIFIKCTSYHRDIMCWLYLIIGNVVWPPSDFSVFDNNEKIGQSFQDEETSERNERRGR